MTKHKIEREPPGTWGFEAKSMPVDEIRDTFEVYAFKTEPMEHQYRALLLGIQLDSFMYALDMGLGKTLISVYLYSMRLREDPQLRMLVVCPPIVLGHWHDEVTKHSDHTVDLVEGTLEQKLHTIENSTADIVVVSYYWLVTQFSKALKDDDHYDRVMRYLSQYKMFTLDEAHVVRNPENVGFKGLCLFRHLFKFFYVLSGTPVGNFETGVWAINYLLDGGETYGESYYQFLDEWFDTKMIANRFPVYTLRRESSKEFYRLFWSRAARWEETDCSDLPEKSYLRVPITLTVEQLRAIAALPVDTEENTKFAEMRITAGIGMSKSPKMEALFEVIREVCVEADTQLIVWCWLRDEIIFCQEAIAEKFSKLNVETLYGATRERARKVHIQNWRSGALNILVANPSSLGLGVNLYETHIAVYYSNSDSLIARKQSEKRIHRKGQTKHCIYIDLLAVNSIDEKNIRNLEHASGRFTELTKDEGSSGV